MHFPAWTNAGNGLQHTLEALIAEANGQQPGSQVLLTRLADVLFVQVLRAWIAKPDSQVTGWLAALTDPQISQSLAHMHRNTAHTWSVEELARTVAMSRSAFASRFSLLVGEPPLSYLRRWRMTIARGLLRDTNGSLSSIAQQIGYGSEAAFSKAFKEMMGVSPGTYRRRE
jgi:transcriptional regulator GlxA family with amidase domain